MLTKRNLVNGDSDIKKELHNINKIGKKFYKSQKILNKILKKIFGLKNLKYIAYFLTKISNKLKNIE